MLSLALATLGMATVWEAGSFLGRSAKARVGAPPVDLGAQNVSFSSGSGALIKGWYCRGAPGHGVVVLMHGVHGNRLAMVNRARLLRQHGYGVLLFDFQGHGESGGEQITFGWRESMDARAALEFMKDRCPGEKIGVVGASLGGAAAVLADPPLEVEAIVLEMVYPNIEAAISDRLRICFGPLGPLLTPLLSYQITPRFGISSSWLRPEAAVARVRTPKLFLCGGSGPAHDISGVQTDV